MPTTFPRTTFYSHRSYPDGWDFSMGHEAITEHGDVAIRTREFPDCRACISTRHEQALMLMRRRRTERSDMVVCAHDYSACTHRDALSMVSRDDAEHCDSCDSWYCRSHHHLEPTGVRSQRCDNCGYRPRCFDVWRCDDCEGRYCDSCYHECSRDRNVNWRDVTLSFHGEPGTNPGGDRYIGLEIEVEEGSGENLPSYFGIVEDGSIDGIEVLTPPARGQALIDIVNTAMDDLSFHGWEGTPSCGLHTHIDLRDRREDMTFLSHLFATAFAIEDVLFAMQDTDRSNSSYAIPLRRDYTFYDSYGMKARDFEFVYNKADKTVQAQRHLLEGRSSKWGNRYYGFNFHSVFHRGTLECRILEGTIDPERVLLWAELLQAIVARVEKGVTYTQLRRLLEMQADHNKVNAMQRFFSLSDDLTAHMRSRMTYGRGFDLGDYRLGTPRTGSTPSIETMQRQALVAPWGWRCPDCGHLSVIGQSRAYHPSWCSSARYAGINPDASIVNDNGMILVSVAEVLARPRSRAARLIQPLVDQWNAVMATTDAIDAVVPPMPDVIRDPVTGGFTLNWAPVDEFVSGIPMPLEDL